MLRTITPLRGRVRPGNSGGPMVDARGQVVATVFAALTGTRAGRAGSRSPTALRAPRERERAGDRGRQQARPVATGRCAG